MCLQSSTTTTTLPSGATMRNWSNVFNSADLHARTSKSTQSTLGTWAGGFGLGTTRGTQFDVKSVDAKSTALFGNVLGSQHSGVGTRFVTIGLHLHATSHSGNSFTIVGIALN